MKKSLPIFCTAVLLSSQAQATSGFFIGADGLQVNARHKAKNSSILIGPQDGAKLEEDNGGYGLNLGVRFDPSFIYPYVPLTYGLEFPARRGFAIFRRDKGLELIMVNRKNLTHFSYLTKILTHLKSIQS